MVTTKGAFKEFFTSPFWLLREISRAFLAGNFLQLLASVHLIPHLAAVSRSPTKDSLLLKSTLKERSVLARLVLKT